MKVYEVLKLVCDFTDRCSLAEKLEALEQTPVLSETEQAQLDELVGCYAMLEDEVATQYQPLLVRESVVPKDFKVYLSTLQREPFEIYAVKDKYNRKVRYKLFDDYLLVFAAQAYITYSYLPLIPEPKSDVQVRLPARVLAYGVTREYYLRQGLYDEADVWESRFKDSLRLCIRRKGEVYMPKRRWL